MLESLKRESNRTYTENGALTYATTASDCLDLFATIGALRGATEAEILHRFSKAWAENADLAMKILFFARDVRGGLGERRVFRTAVRWLAAYKPGAVRKNLRFFAEYGRFDDLLALLGTPCEGAALLLIQEQLNADVQAMNANKPVSLLAKWLPSVNASRAEAVRAAKKIARFLGMNDAAYRKTLVALRARICLIENHLRARDYSFDYEKQPSRALLKYRKAFLRNDWARYRDFLERVSNGQATLHTGALTPYEIVAPFFASIAFDITDVSDISEEDRRSIDITWNTLENFASAENALAVVDGSGSMYMGGNPLPACVALSLGIYFAERNTGAFRGHFITFSDAPQLVEIKGNDILEKLLYCCGFNECANTDLQKTFELILSAAVKGKVPQAEMPSTLYILSDMEFDCCAEGADTTNFEHAKKRFAEHGYQLPRVVFWNVASRNRQQPVTQNEQGVALISGCTPRVFGLLKSGLLSPYAYMMEILGDKRYREITA